MSHLRLNSRQSDDTNNILPVAAAGEVIDGSIQTLQNRAICFEATQTLCNLITNVAGVDVREDEGVGVAAHIAGDVLGLGNYRGDGCIERFAALRIMSTVGPLPEPMVE